MHAERLILLLRQLGVTFYSGVPDTLLSDLVEALSRPRGDIIHVPAVNEGAAIALAPGHYLATGKIGVVYLQNSGLGHAMNPWMSLCHEEAYGIPLLLIVGWRGMPGSGDEPQHAAMGRATLPILRECGFATELIEADSSEESLEQFLTMSVGSSKPAAIVVSKGVLDRKAERVPVSLSAAMSMTEAVSLIVGHLPERDLVVASVGNVGRELDLARRSLGQVSAGERDILCVGGMGHASMVALGAAISNASGRVWLLDGDGSCLMHLGNMAVLGGSVRARVAHVLFDNRIHASTGNQPLAAEVRWVELARTFGYHRACSVTCAHELLAFMSVCVASDAPCFGAVSTTISTGVHLPRPDRALSIRKSHVIAFNTDRD